MEQKPIFLSLSYISQQMDREAVLCPPLAPSLFLSSHVRVFVGAVFLPILPGLSQAEGQSVGLVRTRRHTAVEAVCRNACLPVYHSQHGVN
jgi:hypothetical protein